MTEQDKQFGVTIEFIEGEPETREGGEASGGASPLPENQPCQVPRAELMQRALDHYDEISNHACNWMGLIPEAIRTWGRLEDGETVASLRKRAEDAETHKDVWRDKWENADERAASVDAELAEAQDRHMRDIQAFLAHEVEWLQQLRGKQAELDKCHELHVAAEEREAAVRGFAGKLWERLNGRRCELIKWKVSGEASERDLAELAELQALADECIDAVAPLPIKELEAYMESRGIEIPQARGEEGEK